MAFNGYLIKLGGSAGTVLPMQYMGVTTYKITPCQRMESSAKRAVTGVLNRVTVAHTASKVDFETPTITNLDFGAMMALIRTNYSDAHARKIDLEYYDTVDDDYKTGTFYVPDIETNINNIDLNTNIITYDPVRIAFIEY